LSPKPPSTFAEQAAAEVQRLVERLTAAAHEQAEAEAARITAEAHAASDALSRELDASRQERDAARQERDTVRQELAARTAERDSLKTLATAAQQARQQAEAALAGAEAALAEKASAANKALAAADAARRAAEEARQKDSGLRETAERALAEARSGLDSARLEISALSEQLHSATAARSALEQDARRLAAEADTARHAASQAAIDLETAIDEARAIQVSQTNELRDQVVGAISRTLDGLLNTYRKLTVSKTVPDVLDALTTGLANDFARVALFNVAGDRLEGAQQLGFTSPPIASVTIPLSNASFLTEAVKSGRVQGRTANALAGKSSPFGGTPGFVLVVPIVLRGQSIAVIYADDAGQSTTDFTTPEQRVKFAQLLLYLAVSRMPRLLTQASPQDVARSA
jgi:hypothetical protein